jgi:hypothetical protein
VRNASEKRSSSWYKRSPAVGLCVVCAGFALPARAWSSLNWKSKSGCLGCKSSRLKRRCAFGTASTAVGNYRWERARGSTPIVRTLFSRSATSSLARKFWTLRFCGGITVAPNVELTGRRQRRPARQRINERWPAGRRWRRSGRT